MKPLPLEVREEFPDLKIKDYTITGVVGEGGQGVVLQLEKEGVVYTGKVVHRTWSLTPWIEDLKALRRGVEISQVLDHSSIQKVTEVIDEQDKRRFVVVKPYAEGRSLREMIDTERSIDSERLVDILDKTLSALEYLHDPAQHPSLNAVYHRDIKPDHIIVGDDGNITLIDLDTAKPSGGKTTQYTAVGTRIYAAPESLLGTNDARSDVYSLGFVAVEALLGSIPEELSDSRLSGRKNYSLPEYVPEKIRTVVNKMLLPEPDQRWQSAVDVRKALGTCLEEKVEVVDSSDELMKLKQQYEIEKKGLRRSNVLRVLTTIPPALCLTTAATFIPNGDYGATIVFATAGIGCAAIFESAHHQIGKDFRKDVKLLEQRIKELELEEVTKSPLATRRDVAEVVYNEEKDIFRNSGVITLGGAALWYLGSSGNGQLPELNNFMQTTGMFAMAIGGMLNSGLGLRALLARKELKGLEREIDQIEGQRELEGKPGFFTRMIRRWQDWESENYPGYTRLAYIAERNSTLQKSAVTVSLHSPDAEERQLAEAMDNSYRIHRNFQSSPPYVLRNINVGNYSILRPERERLPALEILCKEDRRVSAVDLDSIYHHDSSKEVRDLAEDMLLSYSKTNMSSFSWTKPFINKVINDYVETLSLLPITTIEENNHLKARNRYKMYIVDRALAPATTFAPYNASTDEQYIAEAAFAKQFPDLAFSQHFTKRLQSPQGVIHDTKRKYNSSLESSSDISRSGLAHRHKVKE